jgi:hypothetical protein
VEAGVLALDHAAVVGGVDRRHGRLEGSGLVALAGALVVVDAELAQDRLLARHRLVLHLHVGVERHEAAVLELRERVDLRERHVAVPEQTGEARDDRSEPVELGAGHARVGDHLLRLEVGEGEEVREVAAPDVVGVVLGHLLDVDPAHVAEQDQRPLGSAVPDDARVVLLLDLGARVHEHPAGHVPADLELKDRLGVAGRLVGGVGELDAARFHPSSAQHL